MKTFNLNLIISHLVFTGKNLDRHSIMTTGRRTSSYFQKEEAEEEAHHKKQNYAIVPSVSTHYKIQV